MSVRQFVIAFGIYGGAAACGMHPRDVMNTPSKALGIALSFLLFCASSQASVFVLGTTLSGPAESPPNASPGTGTALFTYDDVAHTLALNVVFSGLLGTVTASHIHAA